MGWSVGFDRNWNRDIGYGVPAICDYPGCGGAIDRGLAYVCGGEPYGGEDGCGLYFCGSHLLIGQRRQQYFCGGQILIGSHRQQCERCTEGKPPFEATPDTCEWIEWKLTDESWDRWRDENPEAVKAMQALLLAAKTEADR